MANTPVQRNKPSKITFRWLPELDRLLLIGMKQGPAAKHDTIDKVLQLAPELTRGKCWQRIRHLRRIAGRAAREARRYENAKKPVRTGPVRRPPTRPWTTADDDELLTWAGREPVAKIARRLGRSVHAVRFRLRAHSMSAKVTDGWSLEELRKMLRVSRTHHLRRLIGNGMLRVRDPRVTISSLAAFCDKNGPSFQPSAVMKVTAAVVTENSVRSENTGVRIIREIMVATTMSSLFVALFALLASSFRTRAALQAEILALRHQLAVFQKNAPRRLRIHRCDRLLWVVLYRFWSGWRRCLEMVQPATVLRWHRRAFAWHWTRKSRRLPGRPEVAANIRDLIRRMREANPLWGAPRIHGELLKLGIAVAQSTVARYLSRPRKPPSQTWRTFLTNHLAQTVGIDFFTVPTATFRVLFVFVVLSHERRQLVHFGVTEHPTQEWTLQQIREAFPWEQAPRYVLRDRDAIYGRDFAAMTRDMGMVEVLTAPRSPWQKGYASYCTSCVPCTTFSGKRQR